MLKMDVTLNKQMTLNTRNYSSIKPGVSLTLKDIPISKVPEATASLNDLLQELFKIETMSLLVDFYKIQDMESPKDFVKTTFENIEEIDKNITICCDQLENINNS